MIEDSNTEDILKSFKSNNEIKLGETYESNNCGQMKVIKITHENDIDVMFTDGIIIKTTTQDIKNGTVYTDSRMIPTVYGVGYMGIGKFKCTIKGEITWEYVKWLLMLSRCYVKRGGARKSYEGCRVDKKWHNFQEFAKWLNIKKDEMTALGININKLELDKDIKVPGNKIYSEDTCLLIHSWINNIIKSTYRDEQYNLPRGVHVTYSGKYKAVSKIGGGGKLLHLGTFDTVREAFTAYKNHVENYLKQLAKEEKSKGTITQEIYEALMNYTVLPGVDLDEAEKVKHKNYYKSISTCNF